MERTTKVEVRVTPDEKERLKTLAREREMSTSEYVRMAALGQLTITAAPLAAPKTSQTVQSDLPPTGPASIHLYDQAETPQSTP